MMELEDVDTRVFWSSWITLMGPECSHKKDAEDLGLIQNEEAMWLWWQSATGWLWKMEDEAELMTTKPSTRI